MSATLESALTAEQRAEADAADRRMSQQTKALLHYGAMSQQLLQDALRNACRLIETNARECYGLAYWSRAEWEDNWADEDPRSFAEWERLATLANCRPVVDLMPGHCWECGCNYAESEPEGLRAVNRRFVRCQDHAHWTFTRLMSHNED